jgi:hypothetical protein
MHHLPRSLTTKQEKSSDPSRFGAGQNAPLGVTQLSCSATDEGAALRFSGTVVGQRRRARGILDRDRTVAGAADGEVSTKTQIDAREPRRGGKRAQRHGSRSRLPRRADGARRAGATPIGGSRPPRTPASAAKAAAAPRPGTSRPRLRSAPCRSPLCAATSRLALAECGRPASRPSRRSTPSPTLRRPRRRGRGGCAPA